MVTALYEDEAAVIEHYPVIFNLPDCLEIDNIAAVRRDELPGSEPLQSFHEDGQDHLHLLIHS